MPEAKLEINKCPYCSETEIVDTEVFTWGGLSVGTSRKYNTPVHMWVCRNCGSVLHLYAENPEMMFPQKQRRKNKKK